MILKGLYNPETNYNPTDIVLENEVAYQLRHPAPAGTPPTDTGFWNRMSPEMSECAQMIVSYVPANEPVKTEPVKKATTRKKKEE